MIPLEQRAKAAANLAADLYDRWDYLPGHAVENNLAAVVSCLIHEDSTIPGRDRDWPAARVSRTPGPNNPDRRRPAPEDDTDLGLVSWLGRQSKVRAFERVEDERWWAACLRHWDDSDDTGQETTYADADEALLSLLPHVRRCHPDWLTLGEQRVRNIAAVLGVGAVEGLAAMSYDEVTVAISVEIERRDEADVVAEPSTGAEPADLVDLAARVGGWWDQAAHGAVTLEDAARSLGVVKRELDAHLAATAAPGDLVALWETVARLRETLPKLRVRSEFVEDLDAVLGAVGAHRCAPAVEVATEATEDAQSTSSAVLAALMEAEAKRLRSVAETLDVVSTDVRTGRVTGLTPAAPPAEGEAASGDVERVVEVLRGLGVVNQFGSVVPVTGVERHPVTAVAAKLVRALRDASPAVEVAGGWSWPSDPWAHFTGDYIVQASTDGRFTEADIDVIADLMGCADEVRTGRPASPEVEPRPDDPDQIDENFEFVAFAGGPDPDNAAIVQSFGMDRAAAEEHARWLLDGGVAWRRDPEATAGPWGLIDGWQDPDGESWVRPGVPT